MQGQCIDLLPDSVPLLRQLPAIQLWPMSGLFLLDVYDLFLPGGQTEQSDTDGETEERGDRGAAKFLRNGTCVNRI